MEQKTSESPRTEIRTRTFSKQCVVETDDGVEIAVVAMSITTLGSFQEEYVEALLSKLAQTCRTFYLESGNDLKTKP